MESGQKPNEGTVYNIEGTNLSMNQAIEKARLTLGDFNIALLGNNPDFNDFALKVRFGTAQGGEHIWVGQVLFKDDGYYGVVDNLPESTQEVGVNERIKIDSRHISDWMYLNKSKVRGGYTVRLLREMMQPAERAGFDKQTGLVFDQDPGTYLSS